MYLYIDSHCIGCINAGRKKKQKIYISGPVHKTTSPQQTWQEKKKEKYV